jgi:hypothetical protein
MNAKMRVTKRIKEAEQPDRFSLAAGNSYSYFAFDLSAARLHNKQSKQINRK